MTEIGRVGFHKRKVKSNIKRKIKIARRSLLTMTILAFLSVSPKSSLPRFDCMFEKPISVANEIIKSIVDLDFFKLTGKSGLDRRPTLNILVLYN